MDNLFIIHFQPLEKYPPVMNLLRYLENLKGKKSTIHVLTTDHASREKPFETFSIPVHRLAQIAGDSTSLQRLRMYVKFFWLALRLLRKHCPSRILYYETLSAGAPWVYKTFFNKHVELFIHYHEYTTQQEYREGMVLNRLLHRLEMQLYPHAKWVSHTNADRLQLFMSDTGKQAPVHTYIMPNYPPRAWRELAKPKDKESSAKIRFVYLGALSFETTYLKEWATFVAKFPLLYEWDIYSGNYTQDVPIWLNKLHASNIAFKGKVTYEELPSILPCYDVGLILYKGHIPNYVFNAPNKLFEYLACGLNVWFPPVMEGCKPYVTDNTYPKICVFDFEQASQRQIEKAINKSGMQNKMPDYYAENVFLPLKLQLLDDLG